MQLPEQYEHCDRYIKQLMQPWARTFNMLINTRDKTISRKCCKIISKNISDEDWSIVEKSYMSYGKRKKVKLCICSNVVSVILEDMAHTEPDFLTILLAELGGYAPSKDISGKVIHKLVIINNINSITSHVQHALCKFMDELHTYVRFIFTCNSMANISQMLASRCVMARIPIMPPDVQRSVLERTLKKKVSIVSSNYMTNALAAECRDKGIDIDTQRPTWDDHIELIVDTIRSKKLSRNAIMKCDVRTTYWLCSDTIRTRFCRK